VERAGRFAAEIMLRAWARSRSIRDRGCGELGDRLVLRSVRVRLVVFLGKLDKWQSNLESRLPLRNKWQGNGRLDIMDLP
jgi:hypothetical protein